jgi:hypothetical protein
MSFVQEDASFVPLAWWTFQSDSFYHSPLEARRGFGDNELFDPIFDERHAQAAVGDSQVNPGHDDLPAARFTDEHAHQAAVCAGWHVS